ncbi:Activity-regulated cytoskeleton associated protein 1 [Anthophora quadrimaculata]
MAIQMSEEQLYRLLATISMQQAPAPTPMQKSFTCCTARFDGEQTRTKVEDFIATISIYKEVENITDENGIKGLPLLLEGEAATWWQGVKAGVTTWTQATDLLRAAYAPKKPAYAIYAEVFSTKQEDHVATDIFVAQKRALLAELPHNHTEEVQLDMVYGLLKLRIREKISRCSVYSFQELVSKARTLEALEAEAREYQQTIKTKEPVASNKKITRCSFCRKNGHTFEECRRRKNTEERAPKPPGPSCYGCGKPGFIRSRCPNCNQATVSSIEAADFCALSLSQSWNRPTAQIEIDGFKGHAFFDTGAKMSVASKTLHELLASNGTQFQKKKLLIALADGNPRIRTVLCSELTVNLEKRKFTTTFIVLPEAEGNRTLLGIDFLETAGIVINAPQRSWNFVDEPNKHHFFGKEPATTGELPSAKRQKKKEVAVLDTANPLPQMERTQQRDDLFCVPPPVSPLPSTPKKIQQRDDLAYVPRPISPLPPTPEKAPQRELMDELFERCFRSYQIDLASIEVSTLRTEEAEGLDQGEKEEEHPVEYASRLLTTAEKNYSTTEREALAVVWAINKFRGYIEGSEIRVMTDHQPLRWLMTLKTPSGRLARWALLLQEFNIKIDYCPGRSNYVADYLSRPQQDEIDDKSEQDIGLITIDVPRRRSNEIRDEQLKDAEIKKIIDCFEEAEQSENFLHWTQKGYILANGVLYRHAPDTDAEEAQLVVPAQEREKVLPEYHDAPTAGHYGAERTIHRILQRYFWPGLRRDVVRHVRNCIQCQRYKASNLKPAGLLQTPTMQQRFEIVSVDLFGPLPASKNGKRWILIAEDAASRWVELFPLRQATAEACAVTLVNEVFLRYGVPRRLISDNGTQFISGIMQQVTYCLNIQAQFTPVYHPEANPVERKNRDLKTQLAMLVGDQHSTWEEKLPAIRFAMNSAKCSSTGYSAGYLTFGRELRTPEDITRDLRTITLSENFIPEITPKLRQLAETLQRARETLDHAQERQKEHADRKRRPDPGYQPGDLIWVNTHLLSNAEKGITSKFIPKRDGPYIILRKVGATSYEVAARNKPSEPLGTYHTSALTPCNVEDAKLPDTPVAPLRRRGRPRKSTQGPTQRS